MKITFNPSLNKYNLLKKQPSVPIQPLGFDCVSFGAMKKEDFFKNGIDFTVVKTLKAPVSEFDSYEDFNLWCKKRIDEIKNKKFIGKKNITSDDRLALINKWIQFLDGENISNSFILLILENITRELKETNDKLPVNLNKKVAAATIKEIFEKLNKNQKTLINFDRTYRENLHRSYLTGDIQTKDDISAFTGWVHIPSKQNDKENYLYNVERFMALSVDTWCSANEISARIYLENDDIHLYLKNGKTRVGLCVNHIGRVTVADDETNRRRIPYDCVDEVESYIRKNSFLTLPNVQQELIDARLEKIRRLN